MNDILTGQAETFAHHDKIAGTPRGAILLVCEPITAYYAGESFNLPIGQWLRVRSNACDTLTVETALDGKVETVCVQSRDFTSMELKP